MQTVCSLTRIATRLCWRLPIASCLVAIALLVAADPASGQETPGGQEGDSSRSTRTAATNAIPLNRLAGRTQQSINDVVRNPSFFRRMPTQQIQCDPKMLQFLVRRPEVLVNIWELMGITNVSAQRRSPTTFLADDGVGTQCVCDLVYSDSRVHVYYGSGNYDGSMTPRKVKGRCICVLHTKSYDQRDGSQVVAGTMDVFIKLDNFGADLLTRTLGPFVGKTADYNFVETAKFVAQISQLCMRSPAAAQGLAMRLESIDPAVRSEFAGLAARIAANAMPLVEQVESPLVRSQSANTDSNASSSSLRGRLMEPRPQNKPPTQNGFTSRSSGPQVSRSSEHSHSAVLNQSEPSGSLTLTDADGVQPILSRSATPPTAVAKPAINSGEAREITVETIGSLPPAAIRPWKRNAVMRR